MTRLDLVMICLPANAAGMSVAALVVYHGLLPHLWEATGSLLSVLGLFAAALLANSRRLR